MLYLFNSNFICWLIVLGSLVSIYIFFFLFCLSCMPYPLFFLSPIQEPLTAPTCTQPGVTIPHSWPWPVTTSPYFCSSGWSNDWELNKPAVALQLKRNTFRSLRVGEECLASCQISGWSEILFCTRIFRSKFRFWAHKVFFFLFFFKKIISCICGYFVSKM